MKCIQAVVWRNSALCTCVTHVIRDDMSVPSNLAKNMEEDLQYGLGENYMNTVVSRY